jgi:hypothetical protein
MKNLFSGRNNKLKTNKLQKNMRIKLGQKFIHLRRSTNYPWGKGLEKVRPLFM